MVRPVNSATPSEAVVRIGDNRLIAFAPLLLAPAERSDIRALSHSTFTAEPLSRSQGHLRLQTRKLSLRAGATMLGAAGQ